ncbi:MAG: hypothetical protein VKK42_01830 [Lyngbya sp.]|nr:hypothetical protein [Lyngbya sp.]
MFTPDTVSLDITGELFHNPNDLSLFMIDLALGIPSSPEGCYTDFKFPKSSKLNSSVNSLRSR